MKIQSNIVKASELEEETKMLTDLQMEGCINKNHEFLDEEGEVIEENPEVEYEFCTDLSSEVSDEAKELAAEIYEDLIHPPLRGKFLRGLKGKEYKAALLDHKCKCIWLLSNILFIETGKNFNYSCEKIGEWIGVSKEAVRQWEQIYLKKIRFSWDSHEYSQLKKEALIHLDQVKGQKSDFSHNYG